MTAMWRESGASLRLLRHARAWSLARAAAAGLPLPRLSQIELGKANPSHALLEHIVAALGFPMLGLEIARLMLAEAAALPQSAPVPPPAAAVAVLPLAAPGLGPAELGRCLRLLRAARGWTQRRTAAAAGLPRASLSQIEHGTSPPEPPALAALLRCLAVSAPHFTVAALLVRLGQAAERPAASRRRATIALHLDGLDQPGPKLVLAVFDDSGGSPVTSPLQSGHFCPNIP